MEKEKAKQVELGQSMIDKFNDFNKPVVLTDAEFAFLQDLLWQSHFDYRFSDDGEKLSAVAVNGDYLLIKQFQTETMTIESPKQNLILCDTSLKIKRT
ncbi:hypothetical protein ACXO8C_09205 [Lactobacillus delbrueckii subsp. bulgaricus]|nr:hypothetical protein [Lactobacillus delbrueckii subsp. bulgaricus]